MPDSDTPSGAVGYTIDGETEQQLLLSVELPDKYNTGYGIVSFMCLD